VTEIMVAVFLKEVGKSIEVNQSYKEDYPYFDKFIAILGILLNL